MLLLLLLLLLLPLAWASCAAAAALKVGKLCVRGPGHHQPSHACTRHTMARASLRHAMARASLSHAMARASLWGWDGTTRWSPLPTVAPCQPSGYGYRRYTGVFSPPPQNHPAPHLRRAVTAFRVVHRGGVYFNFNFFRPAGRLVDQLWRGCDEVRLAHTRGGEGCGLGSRSR